MIKRLLGQGLIYKEIPNVMFWKSIHS